MSYRKICHFTNSDEHGVAEKERDNSALIISTYFDSITVCGIIICLTPRSFILHNFFHIIFLLFNLRYRTLMSVCI